MNNDEVEIRVAQYGMLPDVDRDHYRRTVAGYYAQAAARELGRSGQLEVATLGVKVGSEIYDHYLKYIGLTSLGSYGLLVRNSHEGQRMPLMALLVKTTDSPEDDGCAVYSWYAWMASVEVKDCGIDLCAAVTHAILGHRNTRLSVIP